MTAGTNEAERGKEEKFINESKYKTVGEFSRMCELDISNTKRLKCWRDHWSYVNLYVIDNDGTHHVDRQRRIDSTHPDVIAFLNKKKRKARK